VWNNLLAHDEGSYPTPNPQAGRSPARSGLLIIFIIILGDQSENPLCWTDRNPLNHDISGEAEKRLTEIKGQHCLPHNQSNSMKQFG
jgi:hypothetical protein